MQFQTLRYGAREFTFSLPEGRLVARLEPDTPPAATPPGELVRRCLERPLGAPPLAELARGKRSAAILIPGKERVAGTEDYVPALVDELVRAGVPEDGIEVVLATGTHEHHLESDVAALLGDAAASRLRWRAHDCNASDELAALGTTSFGTPVSVDRRVLDAEVKVLTGRIVPHYLAGFSGGRAALVPGVAGFETIRANARLALAAAGGLDSRVRPCALDENPVHLDMLEGARMARPDFCLNTLLDAEHRLVGAVAGDPEAAHEEGCRQAERMFRVTVPEPVDVLVTSAGGAPYDGTFMQALEAVFDVRDIVHPGGAILWVAECARGLHPGFLRWNAIASDGEMERAVRERFDLRGHTSLMLRAATRDADVVLWSSLPADTVRALGLHPARTLDAGLDWIRRRYGPGFTYAVAPFASVTCAAVG